MTITIQYLKEMFDWFNQEHFDGGLEKPMFEITHVKYYLGQYHYKYNLWTDGLAESVIRISDYFDRSEEDICNTLIHEMIHLYIRQNRIQDTRPHQAVGTLQGLIVCKVVVCVIRQRLKTITLAYSRAARPTNISPL